MKLTIVIPALDEEGAIAATIERTIAARDIITRDGPVDSVEIVVVSDGSTDRTVEIARKFEPTIRLIVFEENRGYGAAIKKGFETGRGNLVGFLDADGTCDPEFFATLCSALVEEEAAVALGSRMGPASKMPAVRRLGNRIYAFILSALSNRVVTDSASGMRVIRRSALANLYPLPDGLNFTPAMSARVLMDDQMEIVERPMAYEERIGASKLHVVKDGVRFLRTILEMTLMWQPARPFVFASLLLLTLMGLIAMHPIESWIRQGQFGEDMIYRLLFCSFLGTLGVTLLSTGILCSHLRRLLNTNSAAAPPPTFLWTVLDRLYSYRGLLLTAILATPLLIWLVGSGLWTFVIDGYVQTHWSRVVLAGLIVFTVCQMLVTVLVLNILRFHTARATRGALRSASMAESDAVRYQAADRLQHTPTEKILQAQS